MEPALAALVGDPPTGTPEIYLGKSPSPLARIVAPIPPGEPPGMCLALDLREFGFQTVVARASRPCVGCTIRTGGSKLSKLLTVGCTTRWMLSALKPQF